MPPSQRARRAHLSPTRDGRSRPRPASCCGRTSPCVGGRRILASSAVTVIATLQLLATGAEHEPPKNKLALGSSAAGVTSTKNTESSPSNGPCRSHRMPASHPRPRPCSCPHPFPVSELCARGRGHLPSATLPSSHRSCPRLARGNGKHYCCSDSRLKALGAHNPAAHYTVASWRHTRVPSAWEPAPAERHHSTNALGPASSLTRPPMAIRRASKQRSDVGTREPSGGMLRTIKQASWA